MITGGERRQVMKQEKNTKFTSRIGFVLASVGSAVGMGNIWMFPYRWDSTEERHF